MINIKEKIKSFFKEVFVEMKRVTWLSRKEIIRYTLVVLAVTIIVSAFLGGLDYFFSSAIKTFIFK